LADRGLAGHPVLAATAAAYLVAFTAYGVATDARQTVTYPLTVVVAALGIAAIDKRVGLSQVALLGLWLWGLGHIAGGMVGLDGSRVLYNAELLFPIHFDNVVHFIGFGAAGLTAWEAFRLRLASPWMVFVMVWLLGQGVGAINEVVEYIIAKTVEDSNIGGFDNTGRDLIANLLGSSVAGVIAARRTPPSRLFRDSAG
jgi:uncharacterized membrane protein YjdF